MPYLLNAIYLVVLLLAAPWLLYASLAKGKYRHGWAARLWGRVPPRQGDQPCVWLHAVSVGEVNLLAPLIDQLQAQRPELTLVVSTTTLTGYRLAQKKYAHLTVFYCPLDFSWATRAAMRRMRPALLVLAELELWPNLIASARQAGAAVAVVNGRLSERSHRGYRRIRPLLAHVLRQLDLIAVQDPSYAERFIDLGAPADRVRVTGSVKFDGAPTDRGNRTTRQLAALAGFQPEDIVFLAGSTQETEEAAALAAYRQLAGRHPRLRLVLVPRHPERFEAVARQLDASGVAWQRRSRLEREGPRPEARVLLVDAVGELGAWWGTATLGFVGGSLTRRGGQNMIEPAAYGVAVSFGPHTHNFRDVVRQLLGANAAVVVTGEAELARFVARCLDHPDYAAELGRQARDLVGRQTGATGRTVQLLTALLPPARVGGPAGQRAA